MVQAKPAETVILMLEQDDATRELYRRELAKYYRVVACAGEREAWAALQSEPVRGIVLEPAALHDGWAFVAAIRRVAGYSQTPIVVCSTLDDRRRGVEAGVAAYLVKPVMPQALVAALATALHQAVVPGSKLV
jgi:DNA-binding response OmpR family regulator